MSEPQSAWKVLEAREPVVQEKMPRKRLRDWDWFDAGRFLVIFPIYGYALLAWYFVGKYFDKVAGISTCIGIPFSSSPGTHDPVPWLALAVFWVGLGIALAVMLLISLIRRGEPKTSPIPQFVFVAYAVFTFFLLPISIQASQSIPYEGIPDFGTFIVYLFIMLALLLFGIVSLYGRSLGKGYGLIAYSLGILSGFIALYMAAYVAGELNLTGTCP